MSLKNILDFKEIVPANVKNALKQIGDKKK